MARRVRGEPNPDNPILTHAAALEEIDRYCDDAAGWINHRRDQVEDTLDGLHTGILKILERDFALRDVVETDFDPPLSPERTALLNAANKGQRELAAVRYTKDTLASVVGHIAALELIEPIHRMLENDDRHLIDQLGLDGIHERMQQGPSAGVITFGTGRKFAGDDALLILAAQKLFELSYSKASFPPSFHRAFTTWGKRLVVAGTAEHERLSSQGNAQGTRLKELELAIASSGNLREFVEKRNPESNAEHTGIAVNDWYRQFDRRHGWQWEGQTIRFSTFDALRILPRHISLIASPSLMGNAANMRAEVVCRYAGDSNERTPMFDFECDPLTQQILATSRLRVGPDTPRSMVGFCAGTRLVVPTGHDATNALTLVSRGQQMTGSYAAFGTHQDGTPRFCLNPAEMANFATAVLAWALWSRGELSLTFSEHEQWVGKVDTIRMDAFPQEAENVLSARGRSLDLGLPS